MLWFLLACLFRLDENDKDDWIVKNNERIIDDIEVELIPTTTFRMGCINDDPLCFNNEFPVHEVRISQRFYMMKMEVMGTEYKALMGDDGWEAPDFCGTWCPRPDVSWLEAVQFANALSEHKGLEACYEIDGEEVSWDSGVNCEGWRLPTEAEWEAAARGGQFHLYAGSDSYHDVAWYEGNSEGELRYGCGLPENGYGLCDMSGSLWEWVWDYYGNYSSSSQVDPTGPVSGTKRVIRGGALDEEFLYSRVTARMGDDPVDPDKYYAGFRLVRTAD